MVARFCRLVVCLNYFWIFLVFVFNVQIFDCGRIHDVRVLRILIESAVYLQYIFPDEADAQPHLKLLELARKWKAAQQDDDDDD